MSRYATNLAAAVLVAALLAPAAVNAQTHHYSLFAGTQHVWIGMVVHNGGGRRAWVCWDGPEEDDAVWIRIGTTAGLDGDYAIHGDGTSGTHVAQVFHALAFDESGYYANSDCAGDDASPSSPEWKVLNLNGYFIDIYGDGGDDVLLNARGDSIAAGGAGNDDVLTYACDGFAAAHGDGNDDRVRGFAGTCDVLRGHGGNDCLDDLSNGTGYSVYDCGAGNSDEYHYLDSPPGGSGCIWAVSSCPVP